MLKWMITFLLVSAAARGVESEPATSAVGTEMTLEQALLITFENNTSLRMERLDPRIMEKNEAIADEYFDTKLTAGVDYGVDRARATNADERVADDIAMDAGVSKKFSTGTSVSLGVDLDRDESTSSSYDDKLYSDSVDAELTITQSLLRGRGRAVNLASLRKAQINTAISKQELRRYVETLIYNVNNAYWDLFLEQKKLAVYQESYELALAHEREVEIFIHNGKMAEIELATVQGEVSARQEKLINARGAIDSKRLGLLYVLNYHRVVADGWDLRMVPTDNPRQVYQDLEPVGQYVEVALLKRPEIESAVLKVDREQVDLVVTKNGLLPKLDFFISLGSTDYANSFHTADDSYNNNRSVSFGLDYSYSVGRRGAQARFEQDVLGKERALLALDNLKDSISKEVRSAYISCMTGLKTIDAVAVTRDLRSQALKTQTIKFELGKATNTDIANAQRDLLLSQINHTEAVVDYVESRLRLHYLDGSLIERSGLVLPMY